MRGQEQDRDHDAERKAHAPDWFLNQITEVVDFGGSQYIRQ
jgi:hypothetical protein